MNYLSLCGLFVKWCFVSAENDNTRFRNQVLKNYAQKLGIFKLAACRNYNPRRHPVAISLFYNFCRFYFTIPMIFEKQQDIESDLRESPLIFHGNYKQTSKNNFPYYLYHKSNEIYQLRIKIDELLADATVFLGK